ncbi:MAG: MFS transporter [Deltaproteobacteria bacterium]|nr:MFS transporter [Deltaproteobacteria bacterium]
MRGVVISVLAMLFIFSMFYRVSTAVIAPNLISDLSLNAEMIGILGSAFFFSFALMQIPMGPLLDRIGPRVVITCFSLIGAVGAILFAHTHSYNGVLIARILIGIGMAAMLMGTYKVFTLAFPANAFSTLAGFFMSVGTFGNMLAASPLAYFAEHAGWRITFFAAGGATAVLGILCFFILKSLPNVRNNTVTPDTKIVVSFLQSAKLIIGSLSFWQIGIVAFFRYGTFICLQGLWFGLYLIDAKRFTPINAGNILIMLAVGNIVGGPIAGRLSDLSVHGTKAITMAGLTLYCVSLFSLSGIWPIKHQAIFMMVSFFIGFFCSFGTMLSSHIKDLFPLNIAATAMAWLNFFSMMGSAVLMSIFGKLMELYPRSDHGYPPEAYEFCFLICSLSMAVSLVFYAFAKKGRTV